MLVSQQQSQLAVGHDSQGPADQVLHAYTSLPPPPPYTERQHSMQRVSTGAELLADGVMSKEDIQHEVDFVDSTLEWIPRPPTPTRVQGLILDKPVIIPRIDVGSRLKPPLPFLRAYSPDLRVHDIDEASFLAFIDNLAVAQAGSPVFQVASLAGMGIGFVPHYWAQVAGVGIQVAAGVGRAAVAAIRTKKFLTRSNEEYFAPRGLKVSLKKDEELASVFQLPPTQGKLAPVDLGPDSIISMRERRMAVLAPFIAPLTLDVPPPTKQRNLLDKFAAKQLDRKIRKKEKGVQNQQRNAQQKQEFLERLRENGYHVHNEDHCLYVDDSSSDSDSSRTSVTKRVEKLDREILKINQKADNDLLKKGSSKAAGIENERSKELAKVQRDKDKLERKINRKLEKAQEKGRKRDSRFERKIARMEYIVIESLP